MASKNKKVAPEATKVDETKEILPVEEKTNIPEKCEECTEECKGAEECKKDEPEAKADEVLEILKDNIEKVKEVEKEKTNAFMAAWESIVEIRS